MDGKKKIKIDNKLTLHSQKKKTTTTTTNGQHTWKNPTAAEIENKTCYHISRELK